ncbi:10179_t:CDS:2 [Funneliformis geosporum]|nr:10179_t:CDS:2 [Funneliformis geosporum]
MFFFMPYSSCISPIKLIREELALASATSLIAYVEEIPELSDIIDDAKNDDDGNNNHSSQIRETSPRTNREQERFRGLLHELSTPIKEETTETNNEDESSEGSILQNLARLFQKAIKAEKCVTQAYQEEIYCWYYYAEQFEKSVKDVKVNDKRELL